MLCHTFDKRATRTRRRVEVYEVSSDAPLRRVKQLFYRQNKNRRLPERSRFEALHPTANLSNGLY